MRYFCLLWLAFLTTLASLDPAIGVIRHRAGWSVLTDTPPGYAFLTWAPERDEQWKLMLGCSPNHELFLIYVYGVDVPDETTRLTLGLANGTARFEVDGLIVPHPIRPRFASLLKADEQHRRDLGRKLLPVLEGSADITMTIRPTTSADAVLELQIPIEGLAAALRRFRNFCFS